MRCTGWKVGLDVDVGIFCAMNRSNRELRMDDAEIIIDELLIERALDDIDEILVILG